MKTAMTAIFSVAVLGWAGYGKSVDGGSSAKGDQATEGHEAPQAGAGGRRRSEQRPPAPRPQKPARSRKS